MEELIEHFDKVVNGLQVCQVVVTHINADTEIKPCIAPIHDLEVPELKQNEQKWLLLNYVNLHANTSKQQNSQHLDQILAQYQCQMIYGWLALKMIQYFMIH